MATYPYMGEQLSAYTYSSSAWGDLLTNYNGTEISYDALGNPLNWRNAQGLHWDGRQLSYATLGTAEAIDFRYNADGIRTEKNYYSNHETSSTHKVKYILDGTKILAETREDEITGETRTFCYFYDEKGEVAGLEDNGIGYYYQKNTQGDVLRICNEGGNIVAEYTYDAWGKVLSVTDANGNAITNETHVANLNPFRYRSYYYDAETGFYYLNSRYYDPEVGRFISADTVMANIDGDINGYNLFAYCFNNPVNMSDDSGSWPSWATKLVAAVAVVAVLTVVAVATAGTGTAVAAVAAGAAKGAALGFISGAATGTVTGYATTGTLEGTLNGMADGALSGSISGAIAGGVKGYTNYSRAANFLKSNGADPKEVLSSYKGTPKVQTLDADTTVYRTWGGATQELGHWVSPNNYGSSARNLLSLPSCNTMTNTSTFLLEKGTTVLAGKAAPLFGQSGGGVQWWISVLG